MVISQRSQLHSLFCAMTVLKKKAFSSSSSYDSLYLNPLIHLVEKENLAPTNITSNGSSGGGLVSSKGKMLPALATKSQQSKIALKPSSLNLCIRLSEPESSLGGSKPQDLLACSSDIWDFSDTEAAAASSWSTLPNRSLLCRPLPLDVGRCNCIISKESVDGVSFYALYTNEGVGRQDRKLAVALHRRRNGRSEFNIAQNLKGILWSSDDSFLGTITSNLMGSKYQIWEQGRKNDAQRSQFSPLLVVVMFVPTITTLAGSFRSMRVWIPKQQSMLTKATIPTQSQHIKGLPRDWEEKRSIADQLFSREPYYNKLTKRNELDFRERAGRIGPKIQTSVKNFQLGMKEKGRETILQLGRVGKSKYVMDYMYPLTGYKAFCICLASIDTKLCFSV